VKYADPNDLAANKLTDSGVKRVKVAVSHNGVTAGTLSAVRSGTPRGTALLPIE
jgi:hypothetical protein